MLAYRALAGFAWAVCVAFALQALSLSDQLDGRATAAAAIAAAHGAVAFAAGFTGRALWKHGTPARQN